MATGGAGGDATTGNDGGGTADADGGDGGDADADGGDATAGNIGIQAGINLVDIDADGDGDIGIIQDNDATLTQGGNTAKGGGAVATGGDGGDADTASGDGER